MNKTFLFIIFAVLFCRVMAYPEWVNMKDIRVAVMEFSVTSGDNLDTKLMTELFQSSLVDQNAFIVVERRQIEKILSEQKMSLSGLTESEQAAKIGALLGANKIVTGTISKVGKSFILIVKGIDTKSGTIDISDKLYANSMEDMVNKMTLLADRLIRKARGEKIPDLKMEGGSIDENNDSGSSSSSGRRDSDNRQNNTSSNNRNSADGQADFEKLMDLARSRAFLKSDTRLQMIDLSRNVPADRRIYIYNQCSLSGFAGFALNLLPCGVGSWVQRDFVNAGIITGAELLGAAVVYYANSYPALYAGVFLIGIGWAYGLITPWVYTAVYNRQIKDALNDPSAFNFDPGRTLTVARAKPDLVHINLLSLEF